MRVPLRTARGADLPPRQRAGQSLLRVEFGVDLAGSQFGGAAIELRRQRSPPAKLDPGQAASLWIESAQEGFGASRPFPLHQFCLPLKTEMPGLLVIEGALAANLQAGSLGRSRPGRNQLSGAALALDPDSGEQLDLPGLGEDPGSNRAAIQLPLPELDRDRRTGNLTLLLELKNLGGDNQPVTGRHDDLIVESQQAPRWVESGVIGLDPRRLWAGLAGHGVSQDGDIGLDQFVMAIGKGELLGGENPDPLAAVAHPDIAVAEDPRNQLRRHLPLAAGGGDRASLSARLQEGVDHSDHRRHQDHDRHDSAHDL